MKRIIISTNQLKKINEATLSIKSTTPGTGGVLNAIQDPSNMQKYNQLNSVDGTGDSEIMITTPTVNGQDADSKPTIDVDANGNASQAIQQNSTAIDTGKVNVNLRGEIGEQKEKVFSKKIVEEARLEKIRRDGIVISKGALSRSFLNEWEEKPNDDRNQWNTEYQMFIDGLENGDYDISNDTLYVQVYKGKTPDNDPRYVYIRKGENRLHDDHFYIQNSPTLTDEQLRDIYYKVGWEDVLPELIDYDGVEMYENKTGINPEPKTFIVSWMAELTAPKNGKVGGNMLIKAVDKKEAEKRFKKRLFANGYNGEPVSFMLVDLKIEEADNVNEGKIKINPENKGKFNATKKRTGKSTEELTHSKNPKTRKRAIFAQNAKKWNKGKKIK